jgi:hypothetical protein
MGLILTEMAHSADGRGLILISEVSGNAAKANPPIHLGDAITGIKAGPNFRERVTGSNYDIMVDVIGQAKEIAMKSGDNRITLELNRMVKRAHLPVEIDDGMSRTAVEALAEENLRRLLMRRGVQVYDRKTKEVRYAVCQWRLCQGGTLWHLLGTSRTGRQPALANGQYRKLIRKGRPLSWRASRRTVVGASNEGGTIKIRTHPQSRFQVSAGLCCVGALHRILPSRSCLLRQLPGRAQPRRP